MIRQIGSNIILCYSCFKVFESNRDLLHQIAEEKRNKQAVESLYNPVEKELVGLFDEVLQFGSSFMIGNDFQKKDFKQKIQGYESHSLYAGHGFNELDCYAIEGHRGTGTIKPVPVTLWRCRGFGIPTLRLSERYSHIKFLRYVSVD